jgi:hypothetical protein
VSPRVPNRVPSLNLPMHPISDTSFRALPATPYASHAAIAFEPFPFGSHCTCPSSQINGFTVVGSDSYFARCRGRATILGVLATFGVACHAQMTPQDASGVTSCEADLAKCQALLGVVGAKEAEGFVHLAAVTAETGTPSSASEGARLRSSTPPIRLPCAGCMGTDACARGQPVPCRVICARRQQHERRGAAGRHRAVPRVERNELRSHAAGV